MGTGTWCAKGMLSLLYDSITVLLNVTCFHSWILRWDQLQISIDGARCAWWNGQGSLWARILFLTFMHLLWASNVLGFTTILNAALVFYVIMGLGFLRTSGDIYCSGRLWAYPRIVSVLLRIISPDDKIRVTVSIYRLDDLALRWGEIFVHRALECSTLVLWGLLSKLEHFWI